MRRRLVLSSTEFVKGEVDNFDVVRTVCILFTCNVVADRGTKRDCHCLFVVLLLYLLCFLICRLPTSTISKRIA